MITIAIILDLADVVNCRMQLGGISWTEFQEQSVRYRGESQAQYP
jgi:hypothetical protein